MNVSLSLKRRRLLLMKNKMLGDIQHFATEIKNNISNFLISTNY